MIKFSTWKRCFPVNKTRETRTFGESYVDNWTNLDVWLRRSIIGIIDYPPMIPYYLPDSSWAIVGVKITGS